jgi:RecA-family ATPase
MPGAMTYEERERRRTIEKPQPKFAGELDRDFGNDGDSTSEKPLRPMLSWIEYGEREIDRSQYHVGEGFLEIGGFIMLIGQSYAGKSTLLAQVSINMAIGKTWLFFRVERQLRVLVVQAEDPENKCIKMGQMFKRMGLTEEQITLARKNTAVLTIRDLQDKAAIAEIERHAQAFKADVVCINPMTSYLSGSVYKDEVINKFLRVELTPMLDRLKMSAIVIHHPPKPLLSDKEPKDLTAYELQYGGAGMAALTNAPRGNIFLVPVDGDVFKLSVGKGFEDLGTKETVAFLRRSKDEAGIMLWERCESEKAEEATEKLEQRKAKIQKDRFTAYERLLNIFKPTAKYPPAKVIELAKKDLNKGKDWAKDAMRQLVSEKKLAKTEEDNPKGQPFVFYHLPTLLEPVMGDCDSTTEQTGIT